MSTEQQLDDFGGIFSQSQEQIAAQRVDAGSGPTDPDMYKPSLKNKNVKNGVYQSLIRALPNVHDRNLQSVTKWIYFLKNPDAATESVIQMDCSSNWGDRRGLVTLAYMELYQHPSERLRSIAKEFFSRKEYHWRLHQIVKDEQQPDLNGSIKIMRYSKQIDTKYQEMLDGNKSMGIPGCRYTDPFQGKNFILDIREIQNEKGRKQTSYEASKFVDQRSVIQIPGHDALNENDPASMKIIFDYLKQNSPDLSKMAVQKWDSQTEEMMIRSVMVTIDDINIFNTIYKKAYGKQYSSISKPKAEQAEASAPAASKPKAEPQQAANEPATDLGFAEKKTTPPPAPTPIVSAEESAVEEEFNLDDLNIDFNDIP